MKENVVAFGANLKKIRKKSGYTRAKLAQLIAYSEKSIEKWESGSSVPPVETVCALAELFGVTLDSLVYESKTTVKYLLAIDGGGTKTEFLLTDCDKNEISRVRLGASNPVDIGIEETKKILERGIREVCDSINLREVAVFAGLSGGITGDNKRLIKEFLSQFNFSYCDNGSDTENALEIALSDGNGVAVIMGTGIIAFTQKDGTRHRIGGWGYHIDKGGSGYNFGSDALDCALKYIDGRDGSPLIKELVEKRLGKPVPESIGDIYKGGKSAVASFAPCVFEAYDNGDKYAEKIIDFNVREVCEIILAGCKHFEKGSEKVVICGGLGKHSHILKPFFEKHLGQDINVTFTSEPVVNGALSLAQKLSTRR